jgi:hypothetical protein
MHIRMLSLGLALTVTCHASFRVNQILQVPLLRAQAVNSLATDLNGNLIVTGTNVNGGFVSKLDPNGNVVFTFANSGAFPSGALPDTNGDIYWFGAGGGTAPPFPFTKSILGSHSRARTRQVSWSSFTAVTAQSPGLFESAPCSRRRSLWTGWDRQL